MNLNKMEVNEEAFKGHSEANNPLKCSGKAEKSLCNKAYLAKHIDTIHEGKKQFPCEICGKSFFLKTQLAQHIGEIHEGKKPYACDICDYRFSQKGSMKTHVAFVHEGKKPFKCDI